MYFYNVEGVTAQLADLRALPPAVFTQEVLMIENDLKNYALSKFSFDPYQLTTIESVSPENWQRFGSKLSDALRNGDEINVTASSGNVEWPDIEITIVINC